MGRVSEKVSNGSSRTGGFSVSRLDGGRVARRLPCRVAQVGRRSVSILDVAAAAGVGVGTVSRALNGGSVKSSTRERVQQAIDELGYVPSQTARNLKLQRTGIVGLVAETTQAPWFTRLLHGVEVGLRTESTSVALCSLLLTGEYDATPVETWVRERRVDGIVFVRSGRRERALVKAALEANIGVSLVVPDEAVRGAFAFRLANEAGAQSAAEYLLELGHTHAAFFGGPETSVDTRGRLKGLKQTSLTIKARHTRYATDYSVRSGVCAGEQFLKWHDAGTAPSAVVMANDAMALGFMQAVQGRGLRVPQDVSVVGFDGVPEGELSMPTLTTVSQPVTTLGRDACTALLGDPPAQQTTRYPMTLIKRGSTAAVR